MIKRSLFILAFMMLSILQTAQAQPASSLSPRQQQIVLVAAFTATGQIEPLQTTFATALDAGLSINEIREVLIQMYAYAGFPRSLNGLNALLEVVERRKSQGINDPTGKDATPLPANTDIQAYGNQVRNELTGVDMTHNPSAYAQFAPVIDDFLKAHLFGAIFARDVLNHQERELATIGALAAMTGTDAQLAGHLRITLRTGITKDQLHDFAVLLRNQVSSASADRTLALLERM